MRVWIYSPNRGTERADVSVRALENDSAPSSLSFDRQFHIHRALFLRERTAQFRKRNILQLPNAFSRDTKFFTYFLESLRLSAVQTKTLEDDLLFALIQNVQQPADFVTQIFIT